MTAGGIRITNETGVSWIILP